MTILTWDGASNHQVLSKAPFLYLVNNYSSFWLHVSLAMGKQYLELNQRQKVRVTHQEYEQGVEKGNKSILWREGLWCSRQVVPDKKNIDEVETRNLISSLCIDFQINYSSYQQIKSQLEFLKHADKVCSFVLVILRQSIIVICSIAIHLIIDWRFWNRFYLFTETFNIFNATVQ